MDVEATMVHRGIPSATRETTRELILFFGLTLAIQFGACFSVVFFSKQISAYLSTLFHEEVEAFVLLFLGAYSPSLVGVCLALAGKKGAFRELLRSVLRWRVGFTWWGVAFLTIPASNLVADLVSRGLGFTQGPLNMGRYYQALPMLLLHGYIFDDTGPLGEEIGWRGYALPRLLRLLSPLNASIVLGAIWAIWHIPAWFIPGLSFGGKNFLVFSGMCVSMSILMTNTYTNAKRSALVGGIVWHLMLNTTYTSGVGKNDLRTTILLMIAAGLVTWMDRKKMLKTPDEITKNAPDNVASGRETAAKVLGTGDKFVHSADSRPGS